METVETKKPFELLQKYIDWLIAKGASSNYSYAVIRTNFYETHQVTFWNSQVSERYDAMQLLNNPAVTLVEMRRIGLAAGSPFTPERNPTVTVEIPPQTTPPNQPPVVPPTDPDAFFGERMPEDPQRPRVRYFLGPAALKLPVGSAHRLNGELFVIEKPSPFHATGHWVRYDHQLNPV